MYRLRLAMPNLFFGRAPREAIFLFFIFFPGVTSTPCQPPLALDVKMLANY